MTYNLKDNQYNAEDLIFIPLGGTNEIGLNVTLYHIQGKWLMVDCGSGFIENIPGVKMLLPDLQFIFDRKKDLVGLFVTHAHEDHLGAIPYVIDELECPIYTTLFPATFLKIKLSEYSYSKQPKIVIIEPDSEFNIGPFELATLSLTHSSPEMQALVIKTSEGNILHTGDWKFDPNPVVGPISNKKSIIHYASEGILALVGDSTNALSPGISGSELDLQESLIKIIQSCAKMVIVTTFASNLARLQSLFIAAKQSSRKVILVGKSLHRMLRAAKDSGYFTQENQIDHIIEQEDIANYSRKEILVIATGCQGETMAAMSQIIEKNHIIKLMPGDTAIFSSKMIPGNEKQIANLLNKLIIDDVKILTEKEHFVHISGHPCQDELKEMYQLTKPLISIPVHGEPIHIYKHAELAKKYGVPQIVRVKNGSVVKLSKTNAKILGKVQSGYIAIDGNSLIPTGSNVLKDRAILKEAGVIIATILLDEKKEKLYCPPIISTPGCIDSVMDKELFSAIHEIIELIMQKYNNTQDPVELIQKAIKKVIKNKLGKSPIVIVNIKDIHNTKR